MTPTMIQIYRKSKYFGNTIAYATIEFEGGTVVKRCRIVDNNGNLEFRLPETPRTIPCLHCKYPSAIVYKFCPECGNVMPVPKYELTKGGKPKMMATVIYNHDKKWNERISRIMVNCYKFAVNCNYVELQLRINKSNDGELHLGDVIACLTCNEAL